MNLLCGMAGLVPAIPIRKSVAPQSIEITATRRVMTSSRQQARAIALVLDLF
jgi:hypothetical protein